MSVSSKTFSIILAHGARFALVHDRFQHGIQNLSILSKKSYQAEAAQFRQWLDNNTNPRTLWQVDRFFQIDTVAVNGSNVRRLHCLVEKVYPKVRVRPRGIPACLQGILSPDV